jgi:putative FmdB family regulatory protein
MPTYEYACTNPECGHAFSAVQAFTEDSLTECPVCGGPLRKVYGAVGVVFKGSGFYRNDSRQEAKTSASSNGKSGGAKAETADSSGSSDGKSAAAKVETSSSKSAEKTSTAAS